jgi:hypothetical protein
MVKTTYFTGMGYDRDAAIRNANLQADSFINEADGKRKEVSRTFLTFSSNGSFHSATLQLNYETEN